MQVKTLSLKQPWAALVAIGYKTIEVRTWRTAHRGDLLIHASHGVDKTAMAHFLCELPKPWLRRFTKVADLHGVAMCIVQLVDVTPLCTDDGDAAGLKLTPKDCVGKWAWQLERPRRVDPIKLRGRLMLFETADERIVVVPRRVKP